MALPEYPDQEQSNNSSGKLLADNQKQKALKIFSSRLIENSDQEQIVKFDKSQINFAEE